MAERFIFGIPLIARSSSADWRLVEALLGLTLASVAGQSDADYEVIVAGHDRPTAWPADPRIVFLQAAWPAEPVRSDNRDSGRKKAAICRHVLARGGGLLMFLDADDWVHTRLVETARATLGPHEIGGLLERGFVTDVRSLRMAPLPHPAIFDGGFHRVCGSSTVARLCPDDPDPLRRNPHAVLHEHYRWLEVATEHGIAIARLPVLGNYVVNTAANHSETYGPFAAWRRGLSAAVMREGADVDDTTLALFGLSLRQVKAALG